jgi:peptidoglycan/xylan/chitin deacetylase (PgdA/CDA1 family)
MTRLVRTLSFSVLAVMLSVTVSHAGEIALSFDDAPMRDGVFLTGMERAKMLVRKLDSLGVDEVVFFCTTEKIYGPTSGKRLRLYGEAGHKIANHTYSHPHPDQPGARRYMIDVDRAHKTLVEYPNFVHWFRYPFLDEGRTRPIRDSVRAALAERGYSNGYVTVDNYDWYLDRLTREAVADSKTVDLDKLRGLYVKLLWEGILFYDSIGIDCLGRSPKHVLLLHENDLAALFIDTLVTHIRANGWTIISPTKAYTDPIADSLPDVLMNNQGRVVAIAVAHQRAQRGLVHYSEDTEYLDSLFEELGIIRE